ncbi:IS66 family insertion sequence element accessory protein TnpB [Psychrosphaera sp. 1_MG-2023]|uniref:IS66 family insertion sequence element accessory protein TnpB n=1 Tax=Psychrosphaera sp. 1_MG-2023 TaxID=3062643 RepID=UPI0026E2D72B|nr:IS66 family insertion sequence element accessory protein TnpB [Psychrosphaera sp. 1_MG-2023]MDO6721615.1 IS66 family insertion sequence element accessory protein TnpB [Psychrosphaera sp. 1_MG-2023]
MFVDVPEIYLCSQFVDFRKSINGLAAIVESELELSVLTGAVFVFCNKSRDKLKLLYWDNTGFALWHKRLDKDKFKWPRKLNSQTMNLTEQQLNWLLSGYDVIGHQVISTENAAII